MGDSSGGRVLATAVAAGLVVGVGLFLLTGVGGALVYDGGRGIWLVTAGAILFPAVLAAGCGAIVLHYRSHPRWMRLAAALVAAEAGISLALAQVLIGGVSNLMVGGVSLGQLETRMMPLGVLDVAGGNIVILLGLVAIVAVPVLAGALVRGRPPRRSRSWHLAAGAGWLAAGGLGYAVAYVLAFSLVYR